MTVRTIQPPRVEYRCDRCGRGIENEGVIPAGWRFVFARDSEPLVLCDFCTGALVAFQRGARLELIDVLDAGCFVMVDQADDVLAAELRAGERWMEELRRNWQTGGSSS